jgi:hypothetical protein
MSRAEQVARAVLYEGYILYPYRPSSVKNRQRWNFGVIYPQGSTEGASTVETQCLIANPSDQAELDVSVRFLHLKPGSWQEAVEREVVLTGCRLNVAQASACRVETHLDPLQGLVEASAEPLGDSLLSLSVRVTNLTPLPDAEPGRDSLLLHSFVSLHKILTVRGAEFVSLIDPPEAYRHAAARCQNVGIFPVLAGDEEGQRDVMLSSPIILYDYPQVAPESCGELCDSTEIDEILSLRILTLTDEEKNEMRQSDPHARAILERTESMPEEQWMKLHGVLRGLRPATETIQ